MIKNRPVGEIFTDGNVTLKVEECELYCANCHYYDKVNDYCITDMDVCGHCAATHRPDRVDVNFIKQNNDEQ